MSLAYHLPKGLFSLCVPCLDCTYTLRSPSWLRVSTNPSVFAAAAALEGGDSVHFAVETVVQRVAAAVSVSLPPRDGPGATIGDIRDLQLQIAARPLYGEAQLPSPFPCTYTRTETAAAAATAADVAVFKCELWLPSADTWQLAVQIPMAGDFSLLLPEPADYHPRQHLQQQQQQQETLLLLLATETETEEPQEPSINLSVESGCSLEGTISPPVAGTSLLCLLLSPVSPSPGFSVSTSLCLSSTRLAPSPSLALPLLSPCVPSLGVSLLSLPLCVSSSFLHLLLRCCCCCCRCCSRVLQQQDGGTSDNSCLRFNGGLCVSCAKVSLSTSQGGDPP